MGLKKDFYKLNKELDEVFNLVYSDIDALESNIESLDYKVYKDIKSINDKIDALVNFLGVNLEVKPAKSIKEHIVVTKVKKGKK